MLEDHGSKKEKESVGPFPSKEDVLAVIRHSSKPVSKKDLLKHFHVHGAEGRLRLKALLRALKREGLYEKPKTIESAEKPSRALPSSRTKATHLKTHRRKWEDKKPPLEREPLPETILGSVYHTDQGLRFIPMQRKIGIAFQLENAQDFDVSKIGAVFQATVRSEDPPLIRLNAVMGETKDISLLVSHMANLPMEFPKEALDIANKGQVPPLGTREDLRSLPLITIDGKDARDFDDAVWAEPDMDPANPGGWHLIVAIADVAHYVRTGTALDKEAYLRSTSVYFPDRVIPMLPTVLSNGLCSLNPNEDRACMAAHIWIDSEGQKKRHRFCRALMRSSARMVYEQVQTFWETPHHSSHSFLSPLYGAFSALSKARIARGTLELDVPEPSIIFDDTGAVKELIFPKRLDSHRLIEEFMILANVAAAEELGQKKIPCLYRVHESPSFEKLEEIRRLLRHVQVRYEGALKTPQDLTRLLAFVAHSPYHDIVHELVLRAQSQAVYQPKNIGHFGLNLDHYTHFTSPIRRYTDLLTHRGLLKVLGEPDGLTDEAGRAFEEYGIHISAAEKRAQGAEREAMDRYRTQFLSNRVGDTFEVYVTGITKAGLFVTIPEFNASGLVPLRLMQDDYYIYRENPTRLEGRRTKQRFGFGDTLHVRLIEADLTKGRLTFEPNRLEGPQTPTQKAQKHTRKKKYFKR